MKFHSLLLLLPALAAAPSASAQFSIDEVDARQENVTFRDPVKSTPVDVAYFNRARYRAERAAIRKERNKLEFGGGLQGALTSYNDPWIKVSGGDNSIALMANLFLNHTYTKNLFSVETKFIAKFGYNRMKVETTSDDGSTSSDGIWFKNQDEFLISTAPSFRMARNWSYGSILKFRSQFANGYISRTEQKVSDRKSTFLTPGYFDASLGVTYKSPNAKWPFTVNLSPLALSGTFVENAAIRENGYLYGLEDPAKTSKWEGGSSIQIDYDCTFGKRGVIRYRTTLFGFYGWITSVGQRNKYSDYHAFVDAYEAWSSQENPDALDKPVLAIHPTVRWENTIEIKATRFLSTVLSFQLYYNRAQHLDVQTQTLLSVGLSYTFKNK